MIRKRKNKMKKQKFMWKPLTEKTTGRVGEIHYIRKEYKKDPEFSITHENHHI